MGINIFPNNTMQVHFIGICGIGMSGIAEIMYNFGYRVSGSDISKNSNVSRLLSISCNAIGFYNYHDAKNVHGKDIIVYSSAIKSDNQELIEAKKLKIPCIHRSELLCQIIADRLPIVVSGTHGKTTTTSMCAAIVEQACLNPIIVNGGVINSYSSSAKYGFGKIAVIESDESDGSFVGLSPLIGIVTNIERDHMDFYKDMDHMISVFAEFISRVRAIGFYNSTNSIYGAAVLCSDCPNIRKLLSGYQFRSIPIVTYGALDEHNPDYLAINIKVEKANTSFDIKTRDGVWSGFSIPMFGKHNVLNAIAACISSVRLGIPIPVIRNALSSFQGVKRRLTYIGTINGARVYDDYAHHPTEIMAVIDSAESMVNKSNGRTIVVFQPHKYTRLTDLFDGFVSSLCRADIVIILDVYSVNEVVQDSHKNSIDLHNKLCCLTKSYYSASRDATEKLLGEFILSERDVVLFVGAGNINLISDAIVNKR